MGRFSTLVELVHWQTDHDAVEKNLIEGLHALFKQYFLLQFSDLFLVSGFEQFVVEPVLEKLIFSAEADEEPAKSLEFALLLFALEYSEDRFGEGPYDEREDLLKGDHRWYAID